MIWISGKSSIAWISGKCLEIFLEICLEIFLEIIREIFLVWINRPLCFSMHIASRPSAQHNMRKVAVVGGGGCALRDRRWGLKLPLGGTSLTAKDALWDHAEKNRHHAHTLPPLQQRNDDRPRLCSSATTHALDWWARARGSLELHSCPSSDVANHCYHCYTIVNTTTTTCRQKTTANCCTDLAQSSHSGIDGTGYAINFTP